MEHIFSECDLNIINILRIKNIFITNIFDLCCINIKHNNNLDKPVTEKC